MVSRGLDPPAPADDRSLFDRLGGAAGVRAAVAVLYGRVRADPELADYFDGIDLARLEAHQRWFLTAAWGGPDGFTGQDLTTAHAELAVSDQAFTRLVEHLTTVLSDLGAADDDVTAAADRLEDFRSAVVTATNEPDGA